ncbi:MAG: carbohydrate-binding protein [Candidatus Onthomonas sp.]
MQIANVKAEAVERTRPLTESEVTRLLIAQQINTLVVDDNTALRMLDFYPAWAADTAYPTGHKVQHGGKLWRCIQAHTSQEGWEPSTDTAALWEEICETHAGTIDDPIPYSGSMTLMAGLYYIQNYTIYLCTRDTGNPIYNPLAELVGIYVEAV